MSDPKAAVTIPVLRAVCRGFGPMIVLSAGVYVIWVVTEPMRYNISVQWESGDPIIRIILIVIAPALIGGLIHAMQEPRQPSVAPLSSDTKDEGMRLWMTFLGLVAWYVWTAVVEHFSRPPKWWEFGLLLAVGTPLTIWICTHVVSK
jgi:hypothetical protein